MTCSCCSEYSTSAKKLLRIGLDDNHGYVVLTREDAVSSFTSTNCLLLDYSHSRIAYDTVRHAEIVISQHRRWERRKQRVLSHKSSYV